MGEDTFRVGESPVPYGTKSNGGWISLHRKLVDNWLWTQAKVKSKLEAWIDMLLAVRWKEEPEKVLFGFKLIECRRGQSLKSYATWGKRWGWTVGRVRRFFTLLQNEGMIELENVVKTARITIVNYDKYNPPRQQNDTHSTRIRHAFGTHSATEEEREQGEQGKEGEYMGDFASSLQPTASESAGILCELWVTLKSKGCNRKMREHLGAVAKAGIDLEIVRTVMAKARSDITPWGLEAAILDAAAAAVPKDYGEGWR